MQSVDLSALKDLEHDFEHILRELPNARRELHDDIGQAVLGEVRTQINSSGMRNPGKIAGWQEHYVGSGGGYAAIRAIRGTGPTGRYDDSPGAITNYLEGGHKIRKPTGTAKRYRPRIKKPYVDGNHFYAGTRRNAESIALKASEGYAEKVANMLGGEL